MNFTNEQLDEAIKLSKEQQEIISLNTKIFTVVCFVVNLVEIFVLCSLIERNLIISIVIIFAVFLINFASLPLWSPIMLFANKKTRGMYNFRELYSSSKFYIKYKNLATECLNDFGKIDYTAVIDGYLKKEKNKYNRYILLKTKNIYLSLSGRFDEAWQAYEEALKTVPDYKKEDTVYLKLSTLDDQMNGDEFIAVFDANKDEIEKTFVKGREISLINLGIVLLMSYEKFSGRYERAVEFCKMSLRINREVRFEANIKYPNFQHIGEIEKYCALAYCYAMLGDTERAVNGLDMIEERVNMLTCKVPELYINAVREISEIIAKMENK